MEHVNAAWPAVTCPHWKEPLMVESAQGRFLKLLNKGAEHLSRDELGSLAINLSRIILEDS